MEAESKPEARQQLLDLGTIVTNGERAALDLQVAEGKN